MDRVVHHHTVSCGLVRSLCRSARAVHRGQEVFIVVHVVLFMESGRETKVRELEVAISIDENIVGFDVPMVSDQRGAGG